MIDKNTVEILSVEQIFKSRYVIPLYQRNFAWGEEQIGQLIQDICESLQDRQYFIGSLIVMMRQDGTYEVIDGQQRLTTLALLSYVLHFQIENNLYYDSRPEVVLFFRSLSEGAKPPYTDASVSHFCAAIDIMKDKIKEMEEQGGSDLIERFRNFVLNHVCLVREIIPHDTDVASYFEIMNNRGVQLQEHEIVKGLLLEKLKANPKLSQICSLIWDACSQMDDRIQKSFNSKIRKAIFGEDYQSFPLNYEDFGKKLEDIDLDVTITEGLSLDEILNTDTSVKTSVTDEEDAPEVDKEESIIDFPNFLMHVLQLYYGDLLKDDNGKKGIPLHDKYLLKTFRNLEADIDAAEFFYRVLRCRTIFDRYIVKTNFVNDNDEEGREWSLLSPYKYINQQGNKSQLRFRNTFDKDDREHDREHDMIVKALSCIQVCHPSRYYKNYLQTILSWFKEKDEKNIIEIDKEKYLSLLNQYILTELSNERQSQYFGLTDYKPKLQGTYISHIALDYIDYIIWNIKARNISFDGVETEWKQISGLRNFRFQYWNSVEHHYPQKRKNEFPDEGINDFLLNCLGNTFLIGKATNSRLSDKNPEDKANLYDNSSNLAPNRQLIYNITQQSGWGKDQIESHLRFIETIYQKAGQILTGQILV